MARHQATGAPTHNRPGYNPRSVLLLGFGSHCHRAGRMPEADLVCRLPCDEPVDDGAGNRSGDGNRNRTGSRHRVVKFAHRQNPRVDVDA